MMHEIKYKRTILEPSVRDASGSFDRLNILIYRYGKDYSRSRCNRNFGVTFSANVPGAIVVTAKTYDELLKEIPETLKFHVEGMVADGDDVPRWLADGDYEISYHLDAAALIHSCERYASLAAISRASGVNECLLSHYANGIKTPRAKQRMRIVEGIHKIGRTLLNIS